MKTDPRNREEQEWNDELLENRLRDQHSKKDFAFEDDGSIEKCGDCGTPINSHDHCPRCDY